MVDHNLLYPLLSAISVMVAVFSFGSDVRPRQAFAALLLMVTLYLALTAGVMYVQLHG